MELLSLRNITFRYKEVNIINNVSIEVNKGDCISIIGESGGGKSTFLRLCADLISPSSGEIEYNGKNYLEYNPIELRRKISYCSQFPYLFGETVRENLEFPFKIRNKEIDKNKIIEFLNKLNLDKSYLEKDTNSLSGGEKQRISLIRNFIFTPDILLLDEVTSALDDYNTRVVEEYLEEMNKSGVTIVWITHDKEQSKRIFNKRIVIESGKIKEVEVLQAWVHNH